jgi:hypothetical protein
VFVSDSAAGAMGDRNFCTSDLPIAAFSAQLFYRFDNEKNAAHSWVVGRKPASVWIYR